MKLTKFVHACVLVEDDQHVALFDPGTMSWESKLFNVDVLPKLDYVMITHEHFDHFCEPFVHALGHKFPDLQFLSTPVVVSKLKALGIKNVSTSTIENIIIEPLEHDSMQPLMPLPIAKNIAVHYKDKISHPGDSHHLESTKDILFLPLAGPWGSTIEAIRLAVKLKPKAIVPIHDWMWNDDWRMGMYDRMEQFFKEKDIKFIKTVDGESFEL